MKMRIKQLKEIMHWVFKELATINHGEIHIVFKVRDYQVALIEKTKIVKEKPLENMTDQTGDIS